MTVPEKTAPDGPAEAICRALRQGETPRALRLFHEAGGALFAFRHGYEPLGEILDLLPEDAWRADEAVLGALVFYLVKQGRAARAQSFLNAEDLAFEKSRMFEIYPLLTAIHLGAVVSSERLAIWTHLERRLPVSDPLLEGLYHNAMLVLHVRLRSFDKARETAGRAISCYREAGHIYLEHFIHLHLADLDLVEGRLRAARRGLRAAEHCLDESGMTFANEKDLIETIRLAIDYETGNYAHIPGRARQLRPGLLTGDSWAELFVQLGRIAVLSLFFTEGRDAAEQELEQFQADYARRHGGSTAVFDLLAALLYRLDWRPGDAERLFDAAADAPLQSAIGSVIRRELAIALGREAATPGEITGPRGIVLDALHDAGRTTGPARRRAIERALRLAADESLMAPFLEHRDVFLGHSTRLANAGFARGHRGLVRMTTATLARIDQSYTLPQAARALGLSHRQYRVATALSSGASNKQIARQLGTSEATVKYHLTRLYRQFGASKRGELIDLMLEKSLLPIS